MAHYRLAKEKKNKNINRIKLAELEMDESLKVEEIYWSQRANCSWLTEGDVNTKFFHLRASQRKNKILINQIQGPDGIILNNKEDISKTFVDYFKNVYSTNNHNNTHANIYEVVKNRVTPEIFEALGHAYTAEEVRKYIFQLEGTSSPGMDEIPSCFYQHYWDIIGEDILSHTLNILNNNDGRVINMNQTYKCLIPKKPNTLIHIDYFHISLCNVIPKMVTKTITNIIKPHLDKIVNTNQSAFIPNRLIADDIILAYEAFHSF